VSGGKPVLVAGVDLPLWGMEIDPDKAKEEFRSFAGRNEGNVGCPRALL
jgi:arsenite/tail-anchored protein-transporting ATPase